MKPISTISVPRNPSEDSRGVQTSNLTYVKYDNSPKLSAVLLNARSVCNKSLLINDYIVDSNSDILAITETWIKATTPSSVIAELTPPGYSLIHVPRPSQRKGGGVGIIYRYTLKAKVQPARAFSSFE